MRKKQYDYRKSRLIANNYYKRVREAILERERRKLGREPDYADNVFYRFAENTRFANGEKYIWI